MDKWVAKIQAKRACTKQRQASTITSLLAKNEIVEALIVVVEDSFHLQSAVNLLNPIGEQLKIQ